MSDWNDNVRFPVLISLVDGRILLVRSLITGRYTPQVNRNVDSCVPPDFTSVRASTFYCKLKSTTGQLNRFIKKVCVHRYHRNGYCCFTYNDVRSWVLCDEDMLSCDKRLWKSNCCCSGSWKEHRRAKRPKSGAKSRKHQSRGTRNKQHWNTSRPHTLRERVQKTSRQFILSQFNL